MNQRDALLCEICDRPDDDAPRLVFADWLTDHGDPLWAEFIRVQVELARLPAAEERRAGLMEREDELWSAIGERLQAELPKVAGLYWEAFERGLAGWVRVTRLKTLREHREVFRTRAPVRGLWANRLGPNNLASLGGPDDPPGLHRLKLGKPVDANRLRALAGSPLCHRLTSLDLSNSELAPDAVAVVAQSPAFAGLRRLVLDDNFWESSAEGLAEVLAGSEVLSGLTDLSLDSCWLYDEDAAVLAGSPHLTRLERLELHSNTIEVAGLRAFLEGPDRPNLTCFSLGDCEFGDKGAAVVAAWPGLSRVRRLDLGGNRIRPSFVKSLAKKGLLSGVDRIHLFEPRDRSSEPIPGLLSLYHTQMTEKGVERVLRSPHRGRLAYLELWSDSLDTTSLVGSVPESLRRFFVDDDRVC
jgi:uncharacterized protein (TIGR02996 family)